MNNQHPAKILLVEDNNHDIEIAQRAFSQGTTSCELIVVRDGEEALDYLQHRGKYHPVSLSPRPELILLDLNLPKIDGLTVLKKIKADEALRSIPVIILTVSQLSEDILPSYQFGANTYIQKPIEFKSFLRTVKVIQDYWIRTATLPDCNA